MDEDLRPLSRLRGGSRYIDWIDIAPMAAEASGMEITNRRLRDWDLVLTARRIPHHMERRSQRLLTSKIMLERALDELVSFEVENRDRPVAIPPRRPNAWISLLVMFCLLVFQILVDRGWNPLGNIPLDWYDLGVNDSKAVLLDGQWWRPVTALTLHADEAHLLGNMVLGGIFAVLLCREMGAGLGWFCIVVGGWAGNWANNLARGPGHLSLGASTAVFAAVSVLAGYRAFRSKSPDWKGVLTPLAAGLTFLGLLGSGGERTDLGAHLFGFALGLVIGSGVGLLARRRGMPTSWTDKALGLMAVMIPLTAWIRAILWVQN